MNNVKENIHSDFEQFKLNRANYFNIFYENNYNLVYRICFSVLKNKEDSEDVCQGIFEKIYKLPDEKLPTNYEASWLYTVAKNESIQYIRKTKYNLELDEQINSIPNEKNEIENVIESDEYARLVKKLNKKQEQIVSLRVLSNFTFKEISQILSMPIATVQWHYYSSIKSLKIAIGNLAMFLIAVIMGLRYYKVNESTKVNNSNKSSVKKSTKSDESESLDSQTTNKKEPNSKSKGGIATDVLENMDNMRETSVAEEQNISNKISVGFFSIAIVFFIVSIVAVISFLKSKNKRKK